MANDYLSWTFNLAPADLPRALPYFHAGDSEGALSEYIPFDSMISSRNDVLHWMLGKLRDMDGGAGLEPLLLDARRLPGWDEDAVVTAGFVVSGIPASAGPAAMATLRRWLALAADEPAVIARALEDDESTIVEELETAESRPVDEEWDLEGDRAATLFWVLRRLLWLLESAQDDGSVVIQVRWVIV